MNDFRDIQMLARYPLTRNKRTQSGRKASNEQNRDLVMSGDVHRRGRRCRQGRGTRPQVCVVGGGCRGRPDGTTGGREPAARQAWRLRVVASKDPMPQDSSTRSGSAKRSTPTAASCSAATPAKVHGPRERHQHIVCTSVAAQPSQPYCRTTASSLVVLFTLLILHHPAVHQRAEDTDGARLM